MGITRVGILPHSDRASRKRFHSPAGESSPDKLNLPLRTCGFGGHLSPHARRRGWSAGRDINPALPASRVANSLSDKATQPWSRPAKNSCIPPPAEETGILAVLLETLPSGPRMWSESSVVTPNCRSFGGSCLSSLWAAITQSREGLWCFLLSRPLIAVSGIDDRLHRRWTRPGQTLQGRVNHRAREPPKVLLKLPPNE